MSTFLTLCSLVNQEHDSLWCHIYCRWRTYFKTSPLFWVHCAQALWGCHWARLRAWNRWPFFQMQCFHIYFQIFVFYFIWIKAEAFDLCFIATISFGFLLIRHKNEYGQIEKQNRRAQSFWTDMEICVFQDLGLFYPGSPSSCACGSRRSLSQDFGFILSRVSFLLCLWKL